jgi:hypothetical protein
MNSPRRRTRRLRAVTAALFSVTLLALSAPPLVADAFACQNSGYCGG